MNQVKELGISGSLLLDKVIYISRKINSVYKLPELLDAIMKTTAEILAAESASVLLVDDTKANLIFYSVVGDKEELIKQLTVPIEKGIAGFSVTKQQPVISNDVRNDSRFYSAIDEQVKFKTRNIIAFPLIVANEIIGVLEVINAQGRNGFDEKDLKILSYISELSALAIYNRVLYDNLLKSNKDTNKRVQELNALYYLLNAFSMSFNQFNLRDIFKGAANVIKDTLECKRVSIFLKVASGRNLYELVKGIGYKENDLKEGQIISIEEARIMKMVEEYKEPIYILNKNTYNFSIEKVTQRYPTQQFISIPMIYRKEVIGFINATEKITDGETVGFDDYDFSIIKSIAITMGNIYNQYQVNLDTLNQKVMNRELESASQIQQKMLSKNFPKIQGIDIYGYNIPARNVSGDFYGVQKVSDTELAVYIGDVSGKGLPAAFFMATASTALREKINFYKTPQLVVKELNKSVYEESQEGIFVTLAYFLINLEKKKMVYSFAGHNDQFFFDSARNTVMNLKTRGKPAGIIDNIDYDMKELSYKSGDILLLFTDGVTEALINNQEEEGERILKEILQSSYQMNVKDIGMLIKSVFLAEQKEIFDDFTLLIIKF